MSIDTVNDPLGDRRIIGRYKNMNDRTEDWERRQAFKTPIVDEDLINHPSHYQTESGIEVIDVIEAWNLPYHVGNVVKYLLRARAKGEYLENLLKAQWYLNRIIEKIKKDNPGIKPGEMTPMSHEELDQMTRNTKQL